MKQWFIDLERGISNLIYYFKVIWKQRDWDHAYMEELLLTKLERWYKRYSGNIQLPYEGIEKDLQAMRICINILKRRRDSWYTDVWHSKYAYKEDYVFEPIPDKLGYCEMKSIGLTEEEKEKSTEWLHKCNKVEKRDWEIFCDILKKYGERWWD